MVYFGIALLILFFYFQIDRLQRKVNRLERENDVLARGYLGPQNLKYPEPLWKKWFSND